MNVRYRFYIISRGNGWILSTGEGGGLKRGKGERLENRQNWKEREKEKGQRMKGTARDMKRKCVEGKEEGEREREQKEKR